MATMQAVRDDRIVDQRRTDPTAQAFWILRVGFTVAPILFGLDKFFNLMVHWPNYLAPWLDRLIPGSAQDVMYVVGAVEIAAGIIVAIWPEFGGYLVAAWLAGIIVSLLTATPVHFYDIALRDFGLLLGALALARLAAGQRLARTHTSQVDAVSNPSRS
jgi:hypothetical protein